MPKDDKAVVGGVNVAIRHTKQTQQRQGGRIAKELPIELSNLALVDPKTGKADPRRLPHRGRQEGPLRQDSPGRRSDARRD